MTSECVAPALRQQRIHHHARQMMLERENIDKANMTAGWVQVAGE
jgi:hypothetical protein